MYYIKVVLTFEAMDEILSVTIMLYKVVLTLESMGVQTNTVKACCAQSVLSCSFTVKWWTCKVVLTFKSVEEIL